MKTCCGFGHRVVLENIEPELSAAVRGAVLDGCGVFYTGAMGEFDALFSSAVRKVKAQHPHIRLICVKPYFSNDLNTRRDYYAAYYDDVIIPPELTGVHYRAAIPLRNRWLVEHSDLIISYLFRRDGGAFHAIQYAESCGKTIIPVTRSFFDVFNHI